MPADLRIIESADLKVLGAGVSVSFLALSLSEKPTAQPSPTQLNRGSNTKTSFMALGSTQASVA